MTTFDWQQIVGTIGPTTENVRYRLGQVVSIQADYTITVTIAGSTTQISGVRYMADVVPVPSAPVWLTTDGKDIFASSVLAAGNRTLAPRASRSTDQSIPDGTDTAITFDAVNNDPWGAWSAGAATRLTAPMTGRYIAVGQVQWAANGTGWRAAWIERTGTLSLGKVQSISAAAASPTWLNVTTPPFDMTAGTDYIRLIVRQNSGGALAATNQSTYAPSLSLIYLGP